MEPEKSGDDRALTDERSWRRPRDPDRAYLTKARAIRALAHPGRVLILRMLHSAGPSTASECAQVAGMSPSAASYHLKQLARYGFVGEGPSRGDRRERVWEAQVHGIRVDSADPGDKQALAAEAEAARAFVEASRAITERWMRRSPSEPAQWRDAANFAMKVIRVDPETARTLFEQMAALLEPHAADRVGADQAPPGSRLIHAEIRIFPWDNQPDGAVVEVAPLEPPATDPPAEPPYQG